MDNPLVHEGGGLEVRVNQWADPCQMQGQKLGDKAEPLDMAPFRTFCVETQ